MNEKSIQNEVVQSVKRWGGYALKVMDGHVCPQCHHVAVPSVGRADYDCTLGHVGFKIEVKYAEKSFALSQFREEQRKWARWYVLDRHGLYFLWLCMGNGIRSKVHPRRTWMLPLRGWLAIEAYLLTYQKSLPYLAEKGHSKEMQRGRVDAVHLLQDFELDWNSGAWELRRELSPTA